MPFSIDILLYCLVFSDLKVLPPFAVVHRELPLHEIYLILKLLLDLLVLKVDLALKVDDRQSHVLQLKVELLSLDALSVDFRVFRLLDFEYFLVFILDCLF